MKADLAAGHANRIFLCRWGGFLLEPAPGAPCNKWGAEVLCTEARRETQETFLFMRPLARGGFKEGPTTHRSGVVVAALDVVPRAALAAVVAGAYASEYFDRLLRHPFINKQRRNFILDAGPNFIHVERRLSGPAARRGGPRAGQQPAVVFGSEYAWALFKSAEIPTPVVTIDCR